MMRTNLRIHFLYRHVQDTVVILEEGNLPHPHCTACDMFIPWLALNLRQQDMALCACVVDRKIITSGGRGGSGGGSDYVMGL